MRRTSLALSVAAMVFTAPATFAQDEPDTDRQVENQSQQQPATAERTTASDRQDRASSREGRRGGRDARQGRSHAMMGGMSPRMQEMMGNPRMRGLALQTLFALMDADGDGVVTEEEAQSFMSVATQRVFNGVDADGSGEVTLEEFRAFVQGR